MAWGAILQALIPAIASLAGTGAQLGGQAVQGGEMAAATGKAFRRSMWADNTKWQRQVIDMRAAGINPMLAFAQGPSGSPYASTAGVPDYGSGMEELGERVLSDAKQGALMSSNIRTAKEAARRATHEANIASTEDRVANKWADQIKSSEWELMTARWREAIESTRLMEQQRNESSAREVSTRINAALAATDMPKRLLDQKFYESSQGETARQVQRYLESVGGVRFDFPGGMSRQPDVLTPDEQWRRRRRGR